MICEQKQDETKKRRNEQILNVSPLYFGAGYGTRTRRLLLGKQSLYRMS